MLSIKIIALAFLTAPCWSTVNAQPVPARQMRICEIAHQIKIEVDAWNKGRGKGPFLDLAKYGPDLVASIGKDGLFHDFIGTASVGVYGRSHGDPVAETLSALWWAPFATQHVRIDGNLLYSLETANLPEGFAGVFMVQTPILVARYSSLDKIP